LSFYVNGQRCLSSKNQHPDMIFFSYTLHAANLPLPTHGMWRRVGSVDDATSHPFVFLTPADGKSTTTKSPGASQHPGQIISDETSTERSSIVVSRDSCGSSRDLLLDEPPASSDSGNANSGYMLSVVQSVHRYSANVWRSPRKVYLCNSPKAYR